MTSPRLTPLIAALMLTACTSTSPHTTQGDDDPFEVNAPIEEPAAVVPVEVEPPPRPVGPGTETGVGTDVQGKSVSSCKAVHRKALRRFERGRCGRPGHYGNACAIEEDAIEEVVVTCLESAGIQGVSGCHTYPDSVSCRHGVGDVREGAQAQLFDLEGGREPFATAVVAEIARDGRFSLLLDTGALTKKARVVAVFSDQPLAALPLAEISPRHMPADVGAACEDSVAFVSREARWDPETDREIPMAVWTHCEDGERLFRHRGFEADNGEVVQLSWRGPERPLPLFADPGEALVQAIGDTWKAIEPLRVCTTDADCGRLTVVPCDACSEGIQFDVRADKVDEARRLLPDLLTHHEPTCTQARHACASTVMCNSGMCSSAVLDG